MKATIPTTKEVEITHILITVPVRYGEEDIPYDFPMRLDDTWSAKVCIDSGLILGWPVGTSGEMQMKVCDGGIYSLLDASGHELAKIDCDYVPHGVIPGEYGDYIHLIIDESGRITNWPKAPDVSRFFRKEDDVL